MQEDTRLQKAQEAIQYTFKDEELLARALRHSSYINEHDMTYMDCNERLEFLGDAVLEIAVSWLLYETHPEMPEGKLTKLRAGLVCEASLAGAARKLGVGDWLQLGKGEEKTGGREKDSVLADAMEALIGAIFLDGGSFEVNHFINIAIIGSTSEQNLIRDWKTALQEYLQANGKVSIRYYTSEAENITEDRAYFSRVYADDQCLGSGTGRSKKMAQQAAAFDAWKKCKGELPE